ncbi:hypothetical protein [Pseudomonas viridiflava]|uniref:Uncharacterized protein n=1 Tax=Pseudomonas viridiflava TaxID=33069 RepID=A0A3M5PFI9_PSEVI|nr:hypothetical protein [Pseudomonas viridiflava]RMT82957.1 hypothetical protein ALP40_00005 [Pseudomonas viridiflava]
MEPLTRHFISYVDHALTDVEDRHLVYALLSGFHAHTDKLDAYCETYEEMTSNQWTQSSLCTFFCGWRSPDSAAHAVSSIIVRILQESRSLSDDAKLQMLAAARHCGEIIVEDVGLGEMQGHPHHSKLYYRMASAICGSDDWRLQDRFLDPAFNEFSSWVGQARPLAPNLIEALEMMVMTELFSTGEYNLMTPMWKQWLREVRGYPAGDANQVVAFLSAHCASAEVMHFKHAAEALKLYARATEQPLNYRRIERLSREYVPRACEHLGKMASVLKSEVPAWD